MPRLGTREARPAASSWSIAGRIRQDSGVRPVAAPRLAAVPVARLDIEYDGTRFAGWARQPGRRTVQDEIERVLAVAAAASRCG